MTPNGTARGSGPQTPSHYGEEIREFTKRRDTSQSRFRPYLIILMIAVSGLILSGLAIADYCDDSDAHSTCSSCGGSGGDWESYSYKVDCDSCNGEGTIETTLDCSTCEGFGEVECPDCGGTGVDPIIGDIGCETCGGSGDYNDSKFGLGVNRGG